VNEPVAESTESAVKQDAVKIEKMFKRQEEAESIFAYESGSFEEIATQHQKDGLELKNREKIREFNDQIFLIEAEMENEESPAKLRKLDYKAEQCYLRRSLIEIDNAATIEKMTRMEYDEELATAEKAAETNKEKIESKIMIREEVKRLKREAEVHMRNAEEIRKKAPAIQDDIEKADYYRQAFAKEALAIDNLHKIQNICDNIDMLVKYSEQDLAQLRTGKVPNDELAASLTKNSGPKKSEIPVTNETAPAETVVDKKILIAEISGTEKTKTAADNTVSDVAAQPEEIEMTKPVGQENSTNQVLNFSTTTSGDIVTDKKTVTADPNGTVSVNMTVAEPTTKTIPAAVTTTEETLIADKSNAAASTVNAATTSTPKSTESTPKTTGTAVASVESRSTTAPANVAPASSNASASANAEDYYWAMPELVTTDLFKRTNRAVYSDSKPIPIDAEMPKGVYYKVQVGAFRKDIPQNLYDEFAPISGESLSNGITRYTAGFFVQYNNADQVKKEIRSLGYSDAFVVAFRDGKRIPLYEAMGKTESQEFAANIEKEYVYGDKGEAPKANTSVADNSTGAVSNKPLVTDYYKGTPNAVKADQVEAISGLFFTVQVGVYSKPVPAKNVYNITELNSELTESKKIRYTSGRYSSMMDAVQRRSEAKDLGIRDAFITAYYNGKRITLTEADRLLQEKGPSILAK
jgi:hypothetical protein